MEEKKPTEKKNKATEKVENIVEENELSPAEEIKAEIEREKEKAAYSAEKPKKQRQTKSPAEKRDEKIRRAIEKEERREERAKERAEKKETKKQHRLQKKEERKQKQADLRLERLRKKEARLERRDLIKNETRVERAERIAREKQAKRDERAAKREMIMQKREERAALRREKLAARRALKEQQRRLRYENKKDRRSRGIGGWLAAVISLGCVTLVLGTLFTLSLVTRMGGDNLYESALERTFYDLVSYVDNMEVNMSKFMVSGDEREQQKLLGDISLQANLAAADITELPMQDESKYYTTKYINQVGDYAKYLNNKLIDGEKLTETDMENFSKLYEINSNLKLSLSKLSAAIDDDYKFVSMGDDSDANIVLSGFTGLEEGAVEYPKMIYDGPFSDSLETEKVKGLSGEEIEKSEAVEKFKAIFDNYKFDKAEVVGETNGKIPVYNIEAKSGDEEFYAQISKQGGKLISMNCFKDCHEVKADVDAAVKIANAFIEKAGISGMKAVWSSDNAATVYINYAFNDGGVIVYPDMIKVTVCQQRGVVSGFDATEYYLNHTERKIGKAEISEEQAVKNMSTNLEVSSTRLAVIPKGQGKEILAYEIAGTFNGSTYYVYVDAKTGRETQIFKVVETTEGMLLL